MSGLDDLSGWNINESAHALPEIPLGDAPSSPPPALQREALPVREMTREIQLRPSLAAVPPASTPPP